MALKTIDEQPLVTDTVLLEITTPDASGCLNSNPYKVDRVVVYYVERSFVGDNFGEYTKAVADPAARAKCDAALNAFCADPSPANATLLQNARGELASSSQQTTFYYSDRTAVEVIGSAAFPAWIGTDTAESPLTLVTEDGGGNPVFGTFTYEWNPAGSVREGDYFLCWTWSPNPAGDKLSAHVPFSLSGDPAAVSSIPTHTTPAGKYDTLLERYLPDMYKHTISANDMTPQVTDTLNLSVAEGFTFVEDMANQVIDLFDANALNESMLVYLSNLFDLKLKSGDPTLWRRQIKEAVPLFKRKGTLQAVKDSFAQAGMELNGVTQFWQVVSPYTWQESFKVVDSASFPLAKNVVLPTDDANFGLWLRRAGTEEYTPFAKDYVNFEVGDDGVTRVVWVGDELSSGAATLMVGDFLRVLYEYEDVPGYTEQQLENYVRSLPLQDQRDEANQDYPPKNWNVRLIAETDPLFDIIVPARHPFQDPLVFGFVRTEFAYSENIYNMDEFNGSTRPSLDPCHIDKAFIDPCGACLSSSYGVDIGVGELCNDRMSEAQDILRESMPFHAVVHSLNFSGRIDEFVQPPEEGVEFLVTISRVQDVLSGSANEPFFTRIMPGGLGEFAIDRTQLADQVTVLSGKVGTAYNDHVSLVSPDFDLEDLAVIESSHVLRVLSPSPNAGTYSIADATGHTARVTSPVTEPLDESAFTFDLSNVIYSNTTTSIAQDDLVLLSDAAVDYTLLGVKGLWDVANTADYTGGAWAVSVPAYSADPYQVADVVNGRIQLVSDSSLPVSGVSGVSYTLLDDNGNQIAAGDSGSLSVSRRGYVNLNDPYLVNVGEFIKVGDYIYYDGNEYPVLGFDGHNFWVGGYADGDAAGVAVQTRRRLAEGALGYFGYSGLRLTTFADHEAEFGMVDGDNPPPEDSITDDSHFKENYLFLINNELFKISEIDQNQVVLSGRMQNWKTIAAGGTAVAYQIVYFPYKQVNVRFLVFDQLNRTGRDPVVRAIESKVDSNVAINAMLVPPGSNMSDNVAQGEGVSFTITTRSGEIQEGAI